MPKIDSAATTTATANIETCLCDKTESNRQLLLLLMLLLIMKDLFDNQNP
jgi:hypothetical protein